MANTQRQSDVINWQLTGISAERERIKARLAYLDEQEKAIRGAAMTGATTSKNGKAKNRKATTTAPQRQRTISPEQRKKMSDAAKARWAMRKGTAAPDSEANLRLGMAEEVAPAPVV